MKRYALKLTNTGATTALLFEGIRAYSSKRLSCDFVVAQHAYGEDSIHAIYRLHDDRTAQVNDDILQSLCAILKFPRCRESKDIIRSAYGFDVVELKRHLSECWLANSPEDEDARCTCDDSYPDDADSG